MASSTTGKPLPYVRDDINKIVKMVEEKAKLHPAQIGTHSIPEAFKAEVTHDAILEKLYTTLATEISRLVGNGKGLLIQQIEDNEKKTQRTVRVNAEILGRRTTSVFTIYLLIELIKRLKLNADILNVLKDDRGFFTDTSLIAMPAFSVRIFWVFERLDLNHHPHHVVSEHTVLTDMTVFLRNAYYHGNFRIVGGATPIKLNVLAEAYLKHMIGLLFKEKKSDHPLDTTVPDSLHPTEETLTPAIKKTAEEKLNDSSIRKERKRTTVEYVLHETPNSILDDSHLMKKKKLVVPAIKKTAEEKLKDTLIKKELAAAALKKSVEETITNSPIERVTVEYVLHDTFYGPNHLTDGQKSGLNDLFTKTPARKDFELPKSVRDSASGVKPVPKSFKHADSPSKIHGVLSIPSRPNAVAGPENAHKKTMVTNDNKGANVKKSANTIVPLKGKIDSTTHDKCSIDAEWEDDMEWESEGEIVPKPTDKDKDMDYDTDDF